VQQERGYAKDFMAGPNPYRPCVDQWIRVFCKKAAISRETGMPLLLDPLNCNLGARRENISPTACMIPYKGQLCQGKIKMSPFTKIWTDDGITRTFHYNFRGNVQQQPTTTTKPFILKQVRVA
jgi:hypothetical protein